MHDNDAPPSMSFVQHLGTTVYGMLVGWLIIDAIMHVSMAAVQPPAIHRLIGLAVAVTLVGFFIVVTSHERRDPARSRGRASVRPNYVNRVLAGFFGIAGTIALITKHSPSDGMGFLFLVEAAGLLFVAVFSILSVQSAPTTR